jgi:parallel beta-helix repeat protein
VENRLNITVRDCQITNFSRAVHLESVNTSLFDNLTIYGNDNGQFTGIFAKLSNSNNFTSSNLSYNNATKNSGLYLYDSDSNRVDDVIFKYSNVTADDDLYGGGILSLHTNSDYNEFTNTNLTNNNINVNGAIRSGGILSLYSNSDNNTFNDITINENDVTTNNIISGGGIMGVYTSSQNTFSGVTLIENDLNVLTGNGDIYGGGIIGLFSASNYNTFSDSSLINNTVLAEDDFWGGGIIGVYASDSNTLTNTSLDGNDATAEYDVKGGAIMGMWGSDSNTFTNTNLTGSTVSATRADFGIFGLYSAENNTISIGEINKSTKYLITLDSGSDHNVLEGLELYDSGKDAVHVIGTSINNTFDGLTIYDPTSANSGIYSDSQNTTIQNCNIQMSSSNNGYGIELDGSDNSYIFNNTLNGQNRGLLLSSSNSTEILNNTANSNDYGLYVDDSEGNTIRNCTFSENEFYDLFLFADSDNHCSNLIENITGSGGREIRYYNYTVSLSDQVFSELILCNASNSDLTNITISGSETLGNNLLLVTRSNNSVLTNINSSYNYRGIQLGTDTNSTIQNSTANSNTGNGIFLYLANQSSIVNNTANSNGANGIYIYAISDNSIVENNTADFNDDGIEILQSSNARINSNRIFSSASSGIRIWASSNNTISSNDIWNCSSESGTDACIRLYNKADYNLINDNRINNSFQNGIRVGSFSSGTSSHNIFKDMTITNTGAASVRVTGDGSSQSLNNTFLNVTYTDELVGTNSELIRKWHYRAYVNNTNGDDIGGAQVEAYNSSDDPIENLTTASDGWTPTGELIDYVNIEGTTYYYSNYTINASKTNYVTGTKEHNITVSQNIIDDNFELTQSTSIGACGVLYNANTVYTQSANIEPDWDEDPCINITAENVTFDGNGFWIRNTSLAGTGIYSNQINTTIRNCEVEMRSTSPGYGIELENAHNSYVFNNTCNSQYRGIFLSSTQNTTIENNTANSNNVEGIRLTSSSNNALRGNTINSNDYGIRLSSSSNNTLTNNTANSNTKPVDGGMGFLISTSHNNTLINNTANNNDLGFYFNGASDNNLTDNIAYVNHRYGVHLRGESDRNVIIRNDIWNCSIDGSYACIFAFSSDYNIFDSNKINKSYNYGIWVHTIGSGDSSHNIFKDTNMTNIDGTAVFMSDSSSENMNNTFLNFTYNNESVDTASQLIRKWYYKAYVNDTGGNPVSDAYVLAYNNTDDLELNKSTNSTGWTSTTDITEYVNSGGTRSYYSNYTIYAKNSTYPDGVVQRNITGNLLDDVITMGYVSGCGELQSTGTYTLQNDVSSSGTCFNISAFNVTLDCQGYSINYSQGGILGYGVYTGLGNTTVKNCFIYEGNASTGYKHAINFYYAENGTAENNTIETIGAFGYGINLFVSESGILANNTISTTGNSATAVYNIVSDYNRISGNSLSTAGTSAANGILVDTSRYLNITQNNITATSAKPVVINTNINALSYYNHTIDTTNNADGKPLLYDYYNDSAVYENQNLSATYGQVIFAGSDNITIKNCTVTLNGLSLCMINNSLISDNAISTTKTNDYGIWLRTFSYGNNASYNTIDILSTGGWSYGMSFLGNVKNNVIENNNITTIGGWGIGIYFFAYIEDNVFRSNRISTSGNSGHGIYLDGTASNNTFDSHEINVSGNANGIAILDDSYDNVINNSNVSVTGSGTQAYAFYANYDKTNTSIYDSYLHAENNYDIYIGTDQDAGSYLKLFNVTWNESDASINHANFLLYNYNYLDVNVTNKSASSPLVGANVTGSYDNGTQVFSELTAANGFIATQTMLEFTQNITDSYYEGNYTINTSLTGYVLNSTGVSITDNTLLNVALEKSTAPVITSVDVTPDSPVTANPLNCSVTAYDNEQTTLYANFTWYQNASGTLIPETDYDVNEVAFANDTTASTTTNVSAGDDNHTKNVEWICQVTVYDGTGLSDAENGSEIIINTLPSKVTLTSPADGSNTTDRTPTFTWQEASDGDNDALDYILHINGSDFSDDDRWVYVDGAGCGGGSCSYTPTQDLQYFWDDDNYYYNWTVRAYDGEGYGQWSDIWNVSIYTDVVITLYNDTIDFGTLILWEANNTEDDSPDPFRVRNDGNCFLDVNISASDFLWDTQPSQSQYFQYKIGNVTGEAGSLNWSSQNTTKEWTNIPLSNGSIISYLNYSNATDEAEIDILIQVPGGEVAGDKNSIVWFTASFHSEVGT